MVDVGLGQLVTTTGRARARKRKDAVTDNHPFMFMAKKAGGIRRIDGGRTVVEEALSGINNSVSWVGESGTVSHQDYKVSDASEFNWFYMLGAVVWTLAEEYKNSGGSDTKYIPLVGGKFDALEAAQQNVFHAATLSNGTGNGGLQMMGLAGLVPTVINSGTVGGIDVSSSDAEWFRTRKFDTGSDWSDGAVDAGNVKRFLDKLLNGSIRDGKVMIDGLFMGETHWDYLSQALQSMQRIVDESKTGKAGFAQLEYRGVPAFFGGGINYSGQSALTATRTYGLCMKQGGINVVFHEKAEFDMLDPIDSSDQAARSRLCFTMSTMTRGGLAKFNVVGFD